MFSFLKLMFRNRNFLFRVKSTLLNSLKLNPEYNSEEFIVFVGMDDVLYDTSQHMVETYQRNPDGPIIEPQKIDNFLKVMKNDGYFDMLYGIKGAAEALQAMSERCEVFICSSPKTSMPEKTVHKKFEWIKKRLGADWMHRLIITPDKTLFYGDILVDHNHFISGCVNPPKWEHILFNQSQNLRNEELKKNNITDIIRNWTIDDWQPKIRRRKMEEGNGRIRASTMRNGLLSKRLRILIDMDCVLCDFEQHMLDRFREKYPDEPFIKLEDRRTFYLRDQYDTLKPGLGNKMYKLMEEKGFFGTIPEIDGAVDALKEMLSFPRVDVFICSSPIQNEPQHCIREKYEWIKKHLGNDWVDRLILTYDKTLIHGHILIDDKHSIIGCVKQPLWNHFLFAQCHNQHLNEEDFKEKNVFDKIENWTDGSWKIKLLEYKRHLAV